MDLPEFISPPPEKEAIALALDAMIFDPLEADAEAREQATDDQSPPLKAFLLLDASVSPDIPICVEAFSEPARCLFDGAAFEDLSEVGPWLIELRRYGDAWDWYVEDGYGQNWGIVLHTRLPMMKLKTHLKKFTKVEDDQHNTYFFKYYRPQHLNTYLPQFDATQVARFMKGVEAVHAETQGTPHVLQRHVLSGDRLVSTRFDLLEKGMPMRVRPPSDDEVDSLLAQIAAPSETGA